VRLIDHAWIRVYQELWDAFNLCHKIGSKELTLQRPVRGAATIVQYYRSDRSRDYGLQQRGFFGTKELSDSQRKILNGKRTKRDRRSGLYDQTLDFLEDLEESLAEMVENLQERKEDWRAVGRSPADAVSIIRGEQRAVTAEIEQRVQALKEADTLMALVRVLNQNALVKI
jgi:hypothetical protein